MSKQRLFTTGALASALTVVALATSLPAYSSSTGAFVGGMLASRVMTNMHERTQAEQVQAYNSQAQTRQQSAPAASQSPEQRIAQLDKLAAGGYITPAEYKAKKQQIINSM